MAITLVFPVLFKAIPAPAQHTHHPLTGREIAPVMGFPGAGWLERAERDAEERTSLAIKLLNLKPGMVVADIGAGSGYFSRRMAPLVAPSGRVIAVDIQPQMLALLRQLAQREGITNIDTLQNTETDLRLADSSVDLALLVDVYHEFSQPQTMLRGIRQALKPDGRLVLIEYRKEDPAVPIREEHKMSVQQVRKEIEAEGFVLDKVRNELPRQHLFLFRKRTM